MKKASIITSVLALAAASASAEYYTVAPGGETFTSALSSAIISTGGMQGGKATFEFNETKTFGTFTSDFTFENAVLLHNTTTDTVSTDKNMFHANFNINNGATLTFNDITLQAPIKTRFGLYSTSGERGSVFFNEALQITGGVSAGSAEYWLTNVDLTYTSSTGTNFMGYTHFQNGPTITALNTNLTVTVAIRSSSKTDATSAKLAGKLVADNSTLTVATLVNQNKITGNFYCEFAENDAAETFQFNDNLSKFTSVDANPITVLFTNMYWNDKIVSVQDLSTLTRLTINGDTISDLISAGTLSSGMQDGKYVYTYIIPEPAEFAAIFGALALALAFWRRKSAR